MRKLAKQSQSRNRQTRSTQTKSQNWRTTVSVSAHHMQSRVRIMITMRVIGSDHLFVQIASALMFQVGQFMHVTIVASRVVLNVCQFL